jgi:hypothetical protein
MKLVATLLCLALSSLADTGPGGEVRAHCNLAALTRADRERDHQIIPILRDAIQERQELSDGYAYRFPATVLKEVGEWVAIEAKCCQPLTYEVSVAPLPGGAVWVRITGHEAKEFIDAEFAPLMAKLATRGTAK